MRLDEERDAEERVYPRGHKSQVACALSLGLPALRLTQTQEGMKGESTHRRAHTSPHSHQQMHACSKAHGGSCTHTLPGVGPAAPKAACTRPAGAWLQNLHHKHAQTVCVLTHTTARIKDTKTFTQNTHRHTGLQHELQLDQRYTAAMFKTTCVV